MKIWQTFRIIFLVAVILLNAVIGVSTYYAVEKQDCQKKWQSDYLIYSSIGIGVNALINIFIPFNKYMSNFFLIGSIYALAVLVAIITQIYCLYNYDSTIQKCEDVPKTTKDIFKVTKSIGTIGYVGIALGMTLMLLYA